MILTVVRISALRLWHNRAELLLTFIVPLIFFSIFAWIFGSRDSDGGTPRIKIAIADTVGSEASQKIVDALKETRSVRILNELPATNAADQTDAAKSSKLNAATAAMWVRRGSVSAAVVLKTCKNSNDNATRSDDQVEAEIFADSYDQVASQILGAVVQKALISSRQEIAAQAAKLQQSALYSTNSAVFEGSTSDVQGHVQQAANVESLSAANTSLPEVMIRDVLGENKANPVVAMYAAGIAVMFSLFSTTTASGSLLEERENSTLERLLCSKLSIDQLLMGKWLYLSILGFFQITLMFVWGWLVFGVDLPHHLSGFFLMTLASSTAAASFALLIATCCKSRGQLGWLSTIVILVMSALGGSMVPRYLMSESVQRVGMLTFNAWALEGYNKVFWREQSIQTLTLELGVLVGSAFAMLILARGMIARWERA